MFYLEDNTENLSPGRSLRDCSKEVRGEPGYIGVFAKKTRESEHQRITVD